jgi:hypothetical protein
MGLPFVRLGNRTLVHVPTAREWLLGRMQRPNPRRSSTSEQLPRRLRPKQIEPRAE